MARFGSSRRPNCRKCWLVLDAEEACSPRDRVSARSSALEIEAAALDGTIAAIDRDGDEFALVMVRRTEGGKVVMLGEVPRDVAMVERAARHLLG